MCIRSLLEDAECGQLSHLHLTLFLVGVQLQCATKLSSPIRCMVPHHYYGSASGWSSGMYTLCCGLACMDSVPVPIFVAILGTSLAEEIGFPCTNHTCQK